ncbi:GAF domain/HD domain protein [Desulfurella amilsii]|uniref:GAF domain/HD domain protein n=1 Tax=Desulfurella amilsii TaxID=1562698 RepID=A0A1X4XUD8_9BACT|nr:HD domain-containing phosphohydrolase [Desulfurella amilsii]OSS41128.1 GAF domain/HD domain protein [Desulfurella amilsii]
MNKLLYLNEFIKRITNIDEIEQVAKLTAFICRKFFDARNLVFFLEDNGVIKPIYFEKSLSAADLLFYQKFFSCESESFIIYPKEIKYSSHLYKLLSFYESNYLVLKSFDCDNKVRVLLSFGVKELTQDTQDYLESFLNVVKLKIKYLFSMKSLKNSLKATKAALDSSLAVLSNLAEIRDVYTKGHMQRVSAYSRNIALNLKLDNVETIEKAALLHDIGKIGIPDAILLKPAKLSEQEYKFIKKHPEFSEYILSQIKGFEDIIKIIRSHHEYLDGSGYPDGLKNGEIMLEAKIITIADIFDALTTDRPYRKAIGAKEAIKLMFNKFRGKIDEEILSKSVEVLLKSKSMVCDIEQYSQQLEEMRNMVFFIDYETGFYSRHYLPKFSHQIDQDAHLLLLDLHDMRTINFTYSRFVGDKLIYTFSQMIREVFVRYPSEFFRIGGDSFVVVIKQKIENLTNDILDLDHKLKAACKDINPSFWFSSCDFSQGDDINKRLQELTTNIFYKRRVS